MTPRFALRRELLFAAHGKRTACEGVLAAFVKAKKNESRSGGRWQQRGGPHRIAEGRESHERYVQRYRHVSALLGRLFCGALIKPIQGRR